MTPDRLPRHPAMTRALDKRLSIEQRRQALEEWHGDIGRHCHAPFFRAVLNAGGGLANISLRERYVAQITDGRRQPAAGAEADR